MVNWIPCPWLCIDPDFSHKYPHLLYSEYYFKKLKIKGLENEVFFVKHTKSLSWIDKKQSLIMKKHFLDIQNNEEYTRWLVNTVLDKTNNLLKVSETIAQDVHCMPNIHPERLLDLFKLYRATFGELLNYNVIRYFTPFLIKKLKNRIKTNSINLNALIYPIKTKNLEVYHEILTLLVEDTDKKVIEKKYEWYPQILHIINLDKNEIIKHKDLLERNWEKNEIEFKKNYDKIQKDVTYDSIKIIRTITNWFDYFDLIERRTHFNMKFFFLVFYKKLQLFKYTSELECLNYLTDQELEKGSIGELNSAKIPRLIKKRKKEFKIMRCEKGYFFK